MFVFVILQVPLNSWVVLATKRDASKAFEYVEMMKKVCPSLGIKVSVGENHQMKSRKGRGVNGYMPLPHCTCATPLPHCTWGTESMPLPHCTWGTESVPLPHCTCATESVPLPHCTCATESMPLPHCTKLCPSHTVRNYAPPTLYMGH